MLAYGNLFDETGMEFDVLKDAASQNQQFHELNVTVERSPESPSVICIAAY